MITKEKKASVIASVRTHDSDVGSPEAQVAVLTARIQEVTEHLKNNKHDFQARRGLLKMVGQRRRLLQYLQRKDFDAYQTLIKELGIRK